ncbi:uncharacterized protein TRIADDRAFT_62259 [Trichoplax adhaerens]|uniref:IkappaB kinase n=1 Tax=Trichoplax adhaerens TaxID=10228 RepID=B3SDA2_TRIAD|nr:hypothetical protein TRIADDRAFT_62259 [Trichoplax adhaerens]EDV19308.1 hypothetical protein TRIADDRAFT_62259 [Trichoplax adhaerens]|eukprot:XP_002118232.1 hypothetical protein TRIADDRAFT_62259 [Trichoplax adhaerens]
MAKLSHKNLVRTVHAPDDLLAKLQNYGHSITMEYCNGGDLADHLAATRFGLDEVNIKKFINDISSAIACIHSKRIIHRDIKPENILLMSHNGEHTYKLGDFGISKFCTGAEPRTVAKTFAGTSPYMAPEVQIRIQEYTKSVDIWSFGVVIYECVTKSLPFSDVSLQEMEKIDYFMEKPVEAIRTFLDSNGKVQFSTELPIENNLYAPTIQKITNFLQLLLDGNPKRRGGYNEVTNTYQCFNFNELEIFKDTRLIHIVLANTLEIYSVEDDSEGRLNLDEIRRTSLKSFGLSCDISDYKLVLHTAVMDARSKRTKNSWITAMDLTMNKEENIITYDQDIRAKLAFLKNFCKRRRLENMNEKDKYHLYAFRLSINRLFLYMDNILSYCKLGIENTGSLCRTVRKKYQDMQQRMKGILSQITEFNAIYKCYETLFSCDHQWVIECLDEEQKKEWETLTATRTRMKAFEKEMSELEQNMVVIQKEFEIFQSKNLEENISNSMTEFTNSSNKISINYQDLLKCYPTDVNQRRIDEFVQSWTNWYERIKIIHEKCINYLREVLAIMKVISTALEQLNKTPSELTENTVTVQKKVCCDSSYIQYADLAINSLLFCTNEVCEVI